MQKSSAGMRIKMEEKTAGNSDRITREYLDSLLIEMRHIGNKKPDTRFTLYGRQFDTPIMTAALSHLNNVCENGMVEMAKGAKAANAVNWAGMGEKKELEEILATQAETVKIIKPYADNSLIFEKIAHAQKHHALAVGMDIDHAFNGKGEYDKVLDYEMKPKSKEELKEFIQATKLPFIVKGVLSKRDAYQCLQAGAGGIVISHHHGIMDYALPPLKLLPEIAEVIDGEIPIFVDCGILTGTDVFKALALGASAVCVGRAMIEPLGRQGAAGVAEAIQEMTAQLKGVMARTGCSDLAHMDPEVIHRLS